MNGKLAVTKIRSLAAFLALSSSTSLSAAAEPLDAFNGTNRFGKVALTRVMENYHGPALDSEELRDLPTIQFTLFPNGKVAWIHRYEINPKERNVIETNAIAQLREAIAKAAPLPFPSDCLKRPLQIRISSFARPPGSKPRVEMYVVDNPGVYTSIIDKDAIPAGAGDKPLLEVLQKNFHHKQDTKPITAAVWFFVSPDGKVQEATAVTIQTSQEKFVRPSSREVTAQKALRSAIKTSAPLPVAPNPYNNDEPQARILVYESTPKPRLLLLKTNYERCPDRVMYEKDLPEDFRRRK